MKKVYVPFLNQLNDDEWGNEKEAKDGFLAQSNTFTKEVSEAKKLISPGQEQFKLEPEELARFKNSDNSGETTTFFEKKFQEWISKINNSLSDEGDKEKNDAESGPE